MERDFLPVSLFKPLSIQGVHISGTGYSQVLEISLMPGVILSSQPGMMLHCDPEISIDVDTGGLGGATKRVIAGEHPVRLNFTNRTSMPRTVSLCSNVPGNIVPVDLSSVQSFVFKKKAFLAAFGLEWNIHLRLAPNVQAACFGGQGVILNEIRGPGIVFLTGCGSLMEKVLGPGEEIAVESSCVLGFDSAVRFDVSCMGEDCCTYCFAGSGLFNTHFTGPGRILIQSFPIERLKALQGGGNNGGGGGGGDGGGGGGGG